MRSHRIPFDIVNGAKTTHVQKDRGMLTRRTLITRVGAAAVVAACRRVAPGWAGMTRPASTDAARGNPLATKDQVALEDLAMRLYRSPPVKQAMERGRQIMRADPRAGSASGGATLELDLDELAFGACAVAACNHPADPKVYWAINMPHRWFGRDVPGSRCGIDNPDNAYRWIAIDDQSSYVVTGYLPPTVPVDVTFTVFPVWPGVIEAKDGIFPAALGGISLKEIAVESGMFKLSLDPSPANGRRNHVQVKPGATLLFVRDSMSDWSRETPIYLSVERVSGPPAQARDASALNEIAAKHVDVAARFWLDLPAHYYYHGEANRLFTTTNPAIAKGGQFTGNGHFKLGADEAYVLTLDPLGTAYLGVQLADLYGASLEYAQHTSSLTQSQMAPNADGTLTYVLSIQDPSVYNWLDPTGLDAGLFMFRYQGYDPAKVSVDKAIRAERVVKLGELESVLPKGMRRVTAAERRGQLAERAASYSRRLSEVYAAP
jgi:hypothetical protein